MYSRLDIQTDKVENYEAIGPMIRKSVMKNKLQGIDVKEGDPGAINEDTNSIASIQLEIEKEDKNPLEEHTLQLEGEESKVKNNKLMKFEEGGIVDYMKDTKEIMFSEDFSSIMFESKSVNRSDVAF